MQTFPATLFVTKKLPCSVIFDNIRNSQIYIIEEAKLQRVCQV